MKELVLIMAQVMPKEDIAKMMKDAITDWESASENEKKQTWSKVGMCAILISSKEAMEISGKDGMELAQEFNEHNELRKQMTRAKQQ
jgi:hypothetical protein